MKMRVYCAHLLVTYRPEPRWAWLSINLDEVVEEAVGRKASGSGFYKKKHRDLVFCFEDMATAKRKEKKVKEIPEHMRFGRTLRTRVGTA